MPHWRPHESEGMMTRSQAPSSGPETPQEPSRPNRLCINAPVRFPLPHAPAHEMAAAQKRSMEAIIRALAGYAGAEDPAAFAREMSSVMEGAYVTRQVTGEPETAEIAGNVGRLLIEKHLATA